MQQDDGIGISNKVALRLLAIILLAPPILYFGGIFLLFDFKQAAFHTDQEWRDGKKVACGPRPAKWLIHADPSRHYYGNEWIFANYRWLCNRWVERNGYVLPLSREEIHERYEAQSGSGSQ